MAKKCGKTDDGKQKYYYEKTGITGKKYMVCQVPAKGDIPVKGYDPAKHRAGNPNIGDIKPTSDGGEAEFKIVNGRREWVRL